MAGLSNMSFSTSGIQYLDFLQMGVMVVDQHNRIVYWNRWLESHSNIMSEDIMHHEFAEVFPDLAATRLVDVIQQALEERLSAVISAALNQSLLPLYPSINHQLKQMDLMRQMVQVSSISDESGNNFALVQVTDMTHALANAVQLRSHSQAIQNLLSLDELTKLANRKKFDEVLEDEFRRAQRAKSSLMIALFDIDYFKLFNDRYGSQQGNACLAKVAEALKLSLNRSNDLIARFSGQVFGVVMPCTSFDGGIRIAEAMRNAVKKLEIEHDASTVAPVVTVSVGLAYIEPNVDNDLAALLDAAQFAQNQAKQLGGNNAMVYVMQDGSLHGCGNDAGNQQARLEA